MRCYKMRFVRLLQAPRAEVAELSVYGGRVSVRGAVVFGGGKQLGSICHSVQAAERRAL